MRLRSPARRNLHIDETELVRRVFAGKKYRVDIARQRDVLERVVFVGTDECEVSVGVVGWYCPSVAVIARPPF